MTAPIRVTLLNRFLPPSPGITGTLLYRLGAALRERVPELQLSAVGTDLGYGRHRPPDDLPTINAVRLRSWQCNGPALRLPATLHDGQRMAQQAIAADVVLSCSDPPLLGHWLSRSLPRSTRWVEWCMDRYPEALAAAAGLPCPPLWSGRLPDLRLCLGPGQAAWLAGRDRRAVAPLLLPAGVVAAPSTPPPSRQDERLTLIYAGNLGRAHEWQALTMLAQAIDPARCRLIVAAHGVGAVAARRHLAGMAAVDWCDDPVDDDTLNRADVHVASLKPGWTHVCVPSKAVSALCRGRPLLFFGDGASDGWKWAEGSRAKGAGQAAGWRVALDPAGLPDPMGLLMALAVMAEPDYLAAATAAAQAAGDRLRAVETTSIDALAAWLAEDQ
jgi:hypothetical protein